MSAFLKPINFDLAWLVVLAMAATKIPVLQLTINPLLLLARAPLLKYLGVSPVPELFLE